MDELRHVAVESAHAGGEIAYERFRTELTVETKSGKTDVVTQVDRDAQTAITDRITETYPDATIIGEEGGGPTTIPTTGMAWIIDPIDGTANYVRGNRHWATSVACVIDGTPVAAVNLLPALDDTYVGTPETVTRNDTSIQVSTRTDPETFIVTPTIWWPPSRRDEYLAAIDGILTRFADLRRVGSAQTTFSLVADGTIDGAISNIDANVWDTVAGAALIEWAGGTVTNLDGTPWSYTSPGIVASNGAAHEMLVDIAGEIRAVTK